MGETDKNESAKGAEKGSSGAIAALIIGIVGLGIGIAIGMFLPNDSNPAANELECATAADDEPARTNMDDATKTEINAKLDAYEMSGSIGSHLLRPFYWKQLDAKNRIHTVFAYIRETDLADFIAAQKSWNGGDPIVKTVPIDRVKEVYKEIFGEEPTEEDFVSYISCGKVKGMFDYDPANQQYKITYAAGCGGYDREPMDSYRDIYEIEGDTAYITVELGSIAAEGNKDYIVDDYNHDGTRISEFNYDSYDFVNESTKDKFKKYQFIFDKKNDNWVLRGLYPLGLE